MTPSRIPTSHFEKARSYILENGRELERARFEYEFEQESRERVITQLQAFQNEDGGFGHGIEPDFWLPYSSPMATWAAGQILMEIDADMNEPIVKSMLSYLINTNDNETGMWDSVLPKNNEYPHAPWWHWQPGVQERWMFNPGAELAAFLIHWSPENSEGTDIGWNSIQKAVAYLMGKAVMDRHEINNFQKLLKVINRHEEVARVRIPYSLNDVSKKMMGLAEQCVEKDVSVWAEGNKPLPLDFIDRPDHPLCDRFGSLVEQNFSFWLDQMTDEGVWDISWTWSDYPEPFQAARQYWKGILAVNRYKQFKAFGYLD
jgi:hypothetical protein